MAYTVSKEMTVKKIKDTIKVDMVALFEEFLTEKFGAENVKRVRYGSTPKNELAFKVDTVTENGMEYDCCVAINPTVKDWEDRKVGKGVREAFDFDEYAKAYDDYLTDKAIKQAESKARKEKATAKSKEKEERIKENKEALERAEQKSREKTAKMLEEAKAKREALAKTKEEK